MVSSPSAARRCSRAPSTSPVSPSRRERASSSRCATASCCAAVALACAARSCACVSRALSAASSAICARRASSPRRCSSAARIPVPRAASAQARSQVVRRRCAALHGRIDTLLQRSDLRSQLLLLRCRRAARALQGSFQVLHAALRGGGARLCGGASLQQRLLALSLGV
eukprot:scaffold434_cov358-Prasinococcus_capsulatus_cf.AAC.21